MTTRTLTRLFDNHQDAVDTVKALESAGFTRDQISVVAQNESAHYYTSDTADNSEKGAGAGATAGTIIGGGLGVLAGIGALAIPGVGPVVAAGWLVAAITGAGAGAAVGAGAGGLIGALTGAGVSQDDAHVYAEGVRRGGSLVNVRVDETRADEAQRILDGRNYVDIGARRAQYQAGGWTRFDESDPARDARTPDVIREERRTATTL